MEQVSAAILRYFPAGTKVSQPQGGIVLWVEFPESLDSVQLYHASLSKGISIAPGVIFSSQGRYRNFVRIRSAEYTPVIDAALVTVGSIAKALTETSAPVLAASGI